MIENCRFIPPALSLDLQHQFISIGTAYRPIGGTLGNSLTDVGDLNQVRPSALSRTTAWNAQGREIRGTSGSSSSY
jgi:hypothetical protein